MRHIAVQNFCIQQKLYNKKLSICEMPGYENQSDFLANHVDSQTMRGHLARMSFRTVSGLSAMAPMIQIFAGHSVNAGEPKP